MNLSYYTMIFILDCKVGPWGELGPCSSECGAGFQVRTRDITQQPDVGGEPCLVLKETETCFMSPCESGT